MFDKGVKAIQWNKDSLFNKWCWDNQTSTCKKMNLTETLKSEVKVVQSFQTLCDPMDNTVHGNL